APAAPRACRARRGRSWPGCAARSATAGARAGPAGAAANRAGAVANRTGIAANRAGTESSARASFHLGDGICGGVAQAQQSADGEGDDDAEQRIPLPGDPHLTGDVVLHGEEEGVDG